MSASRRTVILDNGAHRIKAGYSDEKAPRLLLNSVIKSKTDRKRAYIADEIEQCNDKSSLFYVLPFERGYLVNWDVELQIWDRVFGKDVLNVEFQESRLVLTDPSDISKAIRDVSPEIVFETYQFDSYLKTSAPSCVAYANFMNNVNKVEETSTLVVDSGYSFTHIVPFIEGKIVRNGIIRIDVGGKVLTNQLKEWISYRQLNVLEETYVMNQCKEDVCFVTTNLQHDIQKCLPGNFIKNESLRRDYVLPDFVNFHRGVVQLPQFNASDVDERAKISLGVERFSIPEILFHPSDVEINQMGIIEAIHHSLNQLPEEFRYLLLKNITLIGGNTLFDGYKKRIEYDLRPCVADCFDFKVYQPDDPIIYAWKCASDLISNSNFVSQEFMSKFVSRAEYNETGANICRNRFQNFYPTYF